MINRRLFIHKFCNNSKMLLSSSWAIFIRALVFSSSPRANFSSSEYLHFSFMLSIMLYYLFWYNKTQSRSFLIQSENTMQWLQKFEQKIICDEKFLEKYWVWGFWKVLKILKYLLLSRYKDVLARTFSQI